MSIRKLLGKVIQPFWGKGLARFPGVAFLYQVLWKAFAPKGIKLVKVQDFEMYVDYKDLVITPCLSLTGIWEPIETEIFQKQLKKGMTVIDIGAHIGYYTLMASKLVGSTGKVYAFEPFPPTYNLLLRNIAYNGFKNIFPANVAVSNKSGDIKLYLSKKTLASNSIINSHPNWKWIKVPSVTLDELFSNVKVDVIKMDIEGAEALALDGMKAIIEANPNLILLTEVFPKALGNAGSSLNDYLGKLQNYFTLILIDEWKRRMKPHSNLTQIEKVAKARGFTNLLCIRK